MFIGQYEHTIDIKGRVSLPARYREIISTQYDGRLVISRLDNYLITLPYQGWHLLVEDLIIQAKSVEELRAFKRFIIAGAYECVVDKLGRILIPPYLRKHAELDKDVVFVGSGKHIEVWNKGRWEKVANGDNERFKETDLLATKFGL